MRLLEHVSVHCCCCALHVYARLIDAVLKILAENEIMNIEDLKRSKFEDVSFAASCPGARWLSAFMYR